MTSIIQYLTTSAASQIILNSWAIGGSPHVSWALINVSTRKHYIEIIPINPYLITITITTSCYSGINTLWSCWNNFVQIWTYLLTLPIEQLIMVVNVIMITICSANCLASTALITINTPASLHTALSLLINTTCDPIIIIIVIGIALYCFKVELT